ncbi:MAG: uroporphyrinogen decarboxylase family protein [Armatimonadota bacterium]
MTRRERLMATLRGEPVDRPAVNFYEVGGFNPDRTDPSEFNIYNDPSWQPLLDLAEEQSDIIRMCGPAITNAPDNCRSEFFTTKQYMENGSLFTKTTLKVAGRTMTSLDRRDPEIATVWALEHLLKDADDLKAYLQLPDEIFSVNIDVSNLFTLEEGIGDKGIIMVDCGDPICQAAPLFSMADYLVIAMTEQELFHALLEKIARYSHKFAETVAKEFPGHLWRICGPEYATEPYLPPKLFHEYVVKYTGPMVQAVQKYGGFPRVHCHGRIKNVLPYFLEMGATGIDPIEPPPQGDVDLSYVRKEFGKELVLFGNLEAADVENMEPSQFEKMVERALREGTEGEGRGLVLMPSSCPYGRKITQRTMTNYQTMIRMASNWS